MICHFDMMHLGTPGQHFAPRTPNRTPWGPDVDFSEFVMDFGSPLGPTLEAFRQLFRNMDHKIAVQIPELVF
jgi:hypothetical protein